MMQVRLPTPMSSFPDCTSASATRFSSGFLQ
jgi:hypothetical protein